MSDLFGVLPCVRGQRVAIVIPDGTRRLPLEAMLSEALTRIQQDQPLRVSVIVALGLHRPMTSGELLSVQHICDAFQVELVQHDAHDASKLTTLSPDIHLFPEERTGVLPVTLHSAVCDADVVLCIGVVEPHQYAGFSGGVKTISIGCAGADTIAALHGLEYLRDPRTTLGQIQGNPFRDALNRVADQLDAPIFALHHVPGLGALIFDEVHDAFSRACAQASRTMLVPHTSRVAGVHLKVTGAKSTNFYQASRAATYVGLIAHSILRPGAIILLEAACQEGLGAGRGERACAAMLSRGLDVLGRELSGQAELPEELILTGGAQRAYVIARLLERAKLVLIGAPHIPELAAVGIRQCDTLKEAMALHDLTSRELLCIEDVFHAVPYSSN